MGRWQAGLTLLEVLVVMALMAVIVGFAMLSTGLAGAGQTAEDEARRLLALTRQFCEDAVLDARQYGIRIEPESYRFSRWDGEQWVEHLDPPIYRPKMLPSSFQLALSVDGRPVILEPDPDNYDPHLICFSSGEMTAFDLAVVTPDGLSFGINGRPDGELDLSGWKEP